MRGYFRMRVTCRVAAAAACALGLATVASAQQSVPGAEGGKLLSPAAKPHSAWPKAPPLSKPGETPAEPSAGWSADDIEAARARCSELLKGLDLVVIPHAPVREGSQCGAPAPVQLVSIGSNPQISFSPPPLLTCDMVAALHRWLQREVQPLARKHLGAPIVSIANMSSLLMPICSRHGSPERAWAHQCHRHRRVPDGRGPDCRGAHRLGADRARGRRQGHCGAGRRRQEGRRREEAAKVRANAGEDGQGAAAYSASHHRPGVTGEFPTVIVGEPPSGSAFGLVPPSRLGGPKPEDSPSSDAPNGKSAFLRAAHRAACAIFRTVLGPEANKAHKNHFHLDMSERKSAAICE